MKVPNAEQAEVAEPKITRYLLDPAHPAGGSKARFFAQFGFGNATWADLAEQLREHVRHHDVVDLRQKEHGMSYAVDGPVNAPDGSRLQIRSVWFIGHGSEVPRFVTAHPLPKP